jgi:isopentenyldiphosphate isomerase
MHRVVHVLVWNQQGKFFLQKRSVTKDIQPGKWDTSVGGHLDPGESLDQAAQRELSEEMGIQGAQLRYLYTYTMRSACETERVATYGLQWDGTITVHAQEIEDGDFFSPAEVERMIADGVCTPNFEEEYRRFQTWRAAHALPGLGA